MKSSGDHPMTGTAEVDETVFGGLKEGVRGRKNGSKKLVVAGMQKKKKCISRLYARMISNADAASPGDFMKHHNATDANVTTDQWTGYRSLAKVFENLVQVPSGKKGSNFPELHRIILNLKGVAQWRAPSRLGLSGLSGLILL